MKKRIISLFLLIAVIAAGVCVFTACGNSGAEAAAKKYAEATAELDSQKMVDCIYFKSDDLKATMKKTFDDAFKSMTEAMESLGVTVSVKGELTTFKYEKTSDMSESDLNKYDLKDGDKIEAGETGKMTIAYTIKVTANGTEVEQKVPETTGTIKLIKVNGTWYIDAATA